MPDDPNLARFDSAKDQPLTVFFARREIVMHSVTGLELDGIASLSNSIHWAFFGLTMGALVSFATVLSTTAINDAKVFAAYVGLAGLSGVGAIYFGIRAAMDYAAAKRKLREIKSSTTGGR